MEHNLGLTCDPVNGLVQIPCIERNAVAAMRAISSVNLSRFLYANRKISFDEVVATMYRTGKDMDEKYRETSHGGLAKIYYGEPRDLPRRPGKNLLRRALSRAAHNRASAFFPTSGRKAEVIFEYALPAERRFRFSGSR